MQNSRRAQRFELSAETSRILQESSGAEGASSVVPVCTAAMTLAARYTYWDQVSIGVAIGGESDQTGPAGDVVPLTVNAAGDLTWNVLAGRVRAAILGSRLAATVWPVDRTLHLHLQLPSQTRLLIAPAATAHEGGSPDTRLVLACHLTEGRVVGALHYDAAVYDEAGAEALCVHFVRMATRSTVEPDRCAPSVDLLDEHERAMLLTGWNRAPRGYPDGTAHELFRRQAEKTPEAVALIDRNRTVRYEELNTRVNRLAHYLRRRGVRLEVPVGIALDRSADAVVAVLAILKAGGLFVPLDPTFPRARLEEMVRDASLALVITRDRFRASLPIEDGRIVSLDRDGETIAAESEDEPQMIGCIDNAAYLLYTSGSTGTPKAIVGIHRSIVAGVCEVPFDAGDVSDICPLNTSLSFGFTIARLFLPLLCGNPLAIIPDGDEKDLPTLVRAWERAGAGNIGIVTPLLRQLLDGGEELLGRLRRVRTVVVGGSMVTRSTIAAFIEAMPHARLIHGYASTEIGTVALTHTLTRAEASRPWSVGTPFPNTAAYVLDRELRLMPPGAVGELCLAAPHMARMYLHRPAQTAQRFVPSPFEAGARLIRTGDLARHLPGGEIEILGRVDDQVKIRGFRIELTEVESRLAEHPHVRCAAAAGREVNGEQRLVAYVGRVDDALSAGTLRAFLAERVPDYMVPSIFMFVDNLPMTGVGKVDRAALPSPAVDYGTAETYVAPRNDLEQQVAAMWSTILGIPRIGVDDHFLDLGGDSLYAMEIIGQVKCAFGVDVPAGLLMSDCATVAGLAARIALAQRPSHAVIA